MDSAAENSGKQRKQREKERKRAEEIPAISQQRESAEKKSGKERKKSTEKAYFYFYFCREVRSAEGIENRIEANILEKGGSTPGMSSRRGRCLG